MSRQRQIGLAICLAVSLMAEGGSIPSYAATVSIPNASFESPVIRVPPYATATIQNWLKASPPGWWTDLGYTLQDWLNTAGIFYNAPVSTFIDNVDGQQAAFVFSTPGVELYQDLAASYEVGQSYQLTAGFQGGGYGMPLGIPLELRLYYRDDDGNRITIAATAALNTTDESQPHARHLDDWQVQIPPVLSTDAWVGKSIGVQIISTVPSESAGGYWRVDNVRLTRVSMPTDFDHDGDVDTSDLEHFEACASGPAIPQTDPACQDARLDLDDDVDQSDFGLFQRCYSGEGIPGNPACLN